MTIRGVFLLIRLTHRRNGGTRPTVWFSANELHATPTAALELGLDTASIRYLPSPSRACQARGARSYTCGVRQPQTQETISMTAKVTARAKC
jgi:hypothetical protein